MNPTVKDTLFCMDCQLHYPRHEAVPVFNPKGVRVRSRCQSCAEKANVMRAMKPEERDEYLGRGD